MPTLWFVASLVVLIVAWQAAVEAELVSRLLFSSPSAVVEAAVSEVQVSRFWTDILATTTEFVLGFGLSVVVGVPVGLILGTQDRVRHLVGPLVDALNSTPQIAFLPLVLVWVGPTGRAAVVIAFLSAVAAVIINTQDGVKTVEPRFLAVARSFGASRTQTFVTVLLPATVPFVIAGLRIGVGHALVSVFVAELFVASSGIGKMIELAGQTLHTERVYLGTLVFIAIGLALFTVVRIVEGRLQHWRPREGGEL